MSPGKTFAVSTDWRPALCTKAAALAELSPIRSGTRQPVAEGDPTGVIEGDGVTAGVVAATDDAPTLVRVTDVGSAFGVSNIIVLPEIVTVNAPVAGDVAGAQVPCS